ncbi:MAG: DUF434 domain-containing protein [Bacillota bacterium]|nr:DUF434 domain-containing protein [Bacillota bacterium]
MSTKVARRGCDPEDDKWFSIETETKLSKAAEDFQYLLNREYRSQPSIDFTGNHYLLSARQRTAIQRSTAAEAQYEKRKASMLPLESAKDGLVIVDGFNLIITLEVALSKSVLILGRDGVIRDLAGLRGTYNIIDKTEEALDLIGKAVKKLSIPEIKFYLDSPVSNSGRLKQKILQQQDKWGIPAEVELAMNPDKEILSFDRIVTSDSIILDNCRGWLNLSRFIIENYVKDAWIVSFIK